MILPDVLVGISRFGPAETQLGFYRLTRNVLFKHIYVYLQVVHAVHVSVSVSVCVLNYKLAVCKCACVYYTLRTCYVQVSV